MLLSVLLPSGASADSQGARLCWRAQFTDTTGKTPAHFVESLRSSARLGQAFERRFGMAPSLFHEMHAAE